MSPNRHGSRKRSNPSSQTFVFNDNTSWSTSIFSGAVTLTKTDLNLPENAADPTIFASLDAQVGSTDKILLITADKGHVMRETTLRYRGRVLVITNNVKKASDQQKALMALSKAKGFKNVEEMFDRYASIHISRNGHDLHINYEDVRGKSPKSKHRVIENVFDD